MVADEVRLMQYYLNYMCTWFDLTDEKRHFAREVPRRAITSPFVMNAILALSARHMSLTQQFDPYAADRYHKACLEQLGDVALGSPKRGQGLQDDDLLAATVLLRTLEEIDVMVNGTDHQGHLTGLQAFINLNTPDSCWRENSLRRASYWVALRQEIVVAFANQRSINISLDLDFVDRSFAPADDDTWANRIILNCAEVVQYCFGPPEGHTVACYHALRQYDADWLRARPPSFLPLAYSEDEESVFPHIVYLNTAVVIGLVHSIFARILLMCYDPTLPRVGAGHRVARQRREEEIRAQVRELCGTALSNQWTIPAMFTAGMGIAAAGDRFDDPREREALRDLLVRTETLHAWPTGAMGLETER